MEFLLEALFQIAGEFLLQIFFEAAVELGLSWFNRGDRRPVHPLVAVCGFFGWGLLAGFISLWPFPNSLIANHSLRILNLVFTPAAAGSVMTLIGKLRQRRGQALVGLDRFFYAFAFALAMALIRYFLAKGPV